MPFQDLGWVFGLVLGFGIGVGYGWGWYADRRTTAWEIVLLCYDSQLVTYTVLGKREKEKDRDR